MSPRKIQRTAAQEMSATTDVVVIGAGPAGLTAGYLLTKQGFNVHIAEKDPRYVGGISRTVEHNGYRFDIGGHRFFSKSREVVALWNEILPDDFITRPRQSRIYYGGKFYSYPLKAFEALFNLGVFRSASCMLSYARARLWPHKDVRTFEQWVTNQFGSQLFSIFFKTYTEKVWGMKCNEISADWAAQRIKGLSLLTAVLDAVKRSVPFLKTARNDGMAVKTLLESFRYPRKGPGMLWEAARDKILAMGGRVEMGAAVTNLSYDRAVGRWRVAMTDSAGATRIVSAAHVISSAPLRELAGQIHPLPRSFNAALNLRYRDFLTVALMYRGDDIFPDNWIYVHDPAVKVGRIQNFRSWSPEMVPHDDVACVGLEYFCFEGDQLWSASDEKLIELAKQEMEKLNLVRGGDCIGGCVVRQEKAYPVYDETYQRNVDAIREELEEAYPTLHLVGRNGMHKYNNQDHAMMTAMLTVRNIVAGERRYNVWGVNEDAEYHEEGFEGAAEALQSVRLVPQRVA
jgi:protoporphyrinogen oxidase